MQPRPEHRLPGRRLDDAAEKPAKVQPRAADHDRRPAPPGDVGDRAVRVPHVVRQRVVHARGDAVDEVMRDAIPFVGGGLRRRHVQSPVHLDRVAADDLAADPLGHAHREAGLAGSRRTDDHEEFGGPGHGATRATSTPV